MGKTILVSSHILPELADICQTRSGSSNRGSCSSTGRGGRRDEGRCGPTIVPQHRRQRPGHRRRPTCSRVRPEVESVVDKNGVMIVKMNEGVNQYGFLANRLIEQGFELTLFKEDEINLENGRSCI